MDKSDNDQVSEDRNEFNLADDGFGFDASYGSEGVAFVGRSRGTMSRKFCRGLPRTCCIMLTAMVTVIIIVSVIVIVREHVTDRIIGTENSTTPEMSTLEAVVTVPPPVQCDETKEWACLDGLTCIPNEARCDGIEDCPMNGEDEQRCGPNCREYQFDCGDGVCVALHFQCNGRPECANGADEAGCDHDGPCLPSHFTCADGTCIPAHQRCNYFYECPDRSDELPETCGSCVGNEFQCNVGNCIPEYWRCDFYPDCVDGEDEVNCSIIHGSEQINITAGNSANIFSPNWPQPYEPGRYHLWNISGSNATVFLLRFHDYDLALQSLLSIFEGHDVSDGSTMLAHFSHTDTPSDVRSYTNEVSVVFHAGAYVGTRGFLLEVTVLESNDSSLPLCNSDHFFCDVTEDCISISFVCNGQVDCNSTTDEANCSTANETLTEGGCIVGSQYECQEHLNATSCIDITQRCDYNLNCPLFDDEVNCTCGPTDFQCTSGQCIPSYFVCDYYYDCIDGNEDELNCGTPNTTYSYTLTAGDPLTIQSPNYPSDYDPKSYAVYYITTPDGLQAVASFHYFLVDWKGFLSFGNGTDVNDHASIFAVFDHHDDPVNVYITSREFFIEFHGGPYGRSRGFDIDLHAI